MTKIDTNPAALRALADEWQWPEPRYSTLEAMGEALHAVVAEKEEQAVPTDTQIAMLDRWMRPEAARELLAQVLASKVGENGIKPNVFYRLDASGEFVEAE